MSGEVTRFDRLCYAHVCEGGMGEGEDGAFVSFDDHRRIVSGLEGQLDQAGIANAVLRDDLAATEARLHEVAVACATAEQERDQLAERVESLEATRKVELAATERLAGIVAQQARVIVGGRDFTTGAKVAPAGIYSLASAAEALRDALDEYDEAVMEASR